MDDSANNTAGKVERSGALFGRGAGSPHVIAAPAEVPGDRSRVAYLGIYLLTLLMFIRPHEVFPGIFGGLPVIKFLAIGTIVIYILSRLSSRERVITWTIEMKMMTLMWVLGMILTPIAVSPGESIDILKDAFANALIVFILLSNLVNTRSRLRMMLFTMVLSGVIFSLGAFKDFLSGGYIGKDGERIKGWSTQFENPNDFAAVLTMILPLIVYFLFTSRGIWKMVYLAATVITCFAVLLTFSRSGFIGMVAASAVVAWNLTKGRRALMVFASAIVLLSLLLAMPGSYMTRLATVFNPSMDQTGSAQERQELIKRAAQLALRRSVVGVGMGNFHVYSIQEKVAHNSYLETAAELGVLGLIAYLTIIFAPLITLRRLQRDSDDRGRHPDREFHVTAVCLQGSLMAYIIYGLFGSVQYFYVLYFFVGFAVALRQIYGAHLSAAPTGGVEEETADRARGSLWRRKGFRGAQPA